VIMNSCSSAKEFILNMLIKRATNLTLPGRGGGQFIHCLCAFKLLLKVSLAYVQMCNY